MDISIDITANQVESVITNWERHIDALHTAFVDEVSNILVRESDWKCWGIYRGFYISETPIMSLLTKQKILEFYEASFFDFHDYILTNKDIKPLGYRYYDRKFKGVSTEKVHALYNACNSKRYRKFKILKQCMEINTTYTVTMPLHEMHFFNTALKLQFS